MISQHYQYQVTPIPVKSKWTQTNENDLCGKKIITAREIQSNQESVFSKFRSALRCVVLTPVLLLKRTAECLFCKETFRVVLIAVTTIWIVEQVPMISFTGSGTEKKMITIGITKTISEVFDKLTENIFA